MRVRAAAVCLAVPFAIACAHAPRTYQQFGKAILLLDRNGFCLEKEGRQVRMLGLYEPGLLVIGRTGRRFCSVPSYAVFRIEKQQIKELTAEIAFPPSN